MLCDVICYYMCLHRYIGTSTTNQHLYILLEYVTGGSISSILKQFGPCNEKLIRYKIVFIVE